MNQGGGCDASIMMFKLNDVQEHLKMSILVAAVVVILFKIVVVCVLRKCIIHFVHFRQQWKQLMMTQGRH